MACFAAQLEVLVRTFGSAPSGTAGAFCHGRLLVSLAGAGVLALLFTLCHCEGASSPGGFTTFVAGPFQAIHYARELGY